MHNSDLITSKLPALMAYQHSIGAPSPPANSFDTGAPGRVKAIFSSKAKCASCRAAPLLADILLEIVIDDFEAM